MGANLGTKLEVKGHILENIFLAMIFKDSQNFNDDVWGHFSELNLGTYPLTAWIPRNGEPCPR